MSESVVINNNRAASKITSLIIIYGTMRFVNTNRKNLSLPIRANIFHKTASVQGSSACMLIIASAELQFTLTQGKLKASFSLDQIK